MGKIVKLDVIKLWKCIFLNCYTCCEGYMEWNMYCANVLLKIQCDIYFSSCMFIMMFYVIYYL